MATAIAPVNNITGHDLRLLRVDRRLSVSQVARAAGVTRQRIGNVEAADRPTRRASALYLAALDRADAER